VSEEWQKHEHPLEKTSDSTSNIRHPTPNAE